MALNATDLTEHTMKKVAATFTASTAAIATTSIFAPAATAVATSTTVVVEGRTATMIALCGNVGRGVRATIADLPALFMAHELSLQLLKSYGFSTIGHASHN